MIFIDRMPVQGPITQAFGVLSVTGTIHSGVDIACQEGTPVRACEDGVVFDFTNSLQEWPRGSGQMVRAYGVGVALRHDRQDTLFYSLCAHLKRADVAVGDTVVAGQLIGLSGSTGVSTGGHVHFMLSKDQSMQSGTANNFDPDLALKEGVKVQTEIDTIKQQIVEREKLREIAGGDYDNMNAIYSLLTRKGFVIPNTADDLNGALVRRFALIELAASNKYHNAYEAWVNS